MYTRETVHCVKVLLILQRPKLHYVLVCHLLHLIYLLSLDICTNHSFIECSITWWFQGVLEFSAGTTGKVTVKVQIMMHETVLWTEQKTQFFCRGYTISNLLGTDLNWSYDHANIITIVIITSVTSYKVCTEWIWIEGVGKNVNKKHFFPFLCKCDMER